MDASSFSAASSLPSTASVRSGGSCEPSIPRRAAAAGGDCRMHLDLETEMSAPERQVQVSLTRANPPASLRSGAFVMVMCTVDNSGLKPPWKPGQSGNPAGRPKGISLRARMKKRDADAWKTFDYLLNEADNEMRARMFFLYLSFRFSELAPEAANAAR